MTSKKDRDDFIAGTGSGSRRSRLGMMLALAAAAEPVGLGVVTVKALSRPSELPKMPRVKDREGKKERAKQRAKTKKRRGW